MMRAQTVLSVLQTIGLVVLIIHSFRDADQITEPGPRDARVTEVARPLRPSARVDDTALLANEDRLRKVVREELTRLQSKPDQTGNATRQAVAVRATEDAAHRAARELVERRIVSYVEGQIASYQAAGSISNEQMIALQMSIAKLDGPSRKQMMSRLTRAMNAGEIKGNF